MALWGLALDAAERFFNSVIMRAHSFIKPKASPYGIGVTLYGYLVIWGGIIREVTKDKGHMGREWSKGERREGKGKERKGKERKG